MNERIRELESQCWERRSHPNAQAAMGDRFNTKKFAELIVEDHAKKTIQGLMSDPAFVQAMDEYYENKCSHRFD